MHTCCGLTVLVNDKRSRTRQTVHLCEAVLMHLYADLHFHFHSLKRLGVGAVQIAKLSALLKPPLLPNTSLTMMEYQAENNCLLNIEPLGPSQNIFLQLLNTLLNIIGSTLGDISVFFDNFAAYLVDSVLFTFHSTGKGLIGSRLSFRISYDSSSSTSRRRRRRGQKAAMSNGRNVLHNPPETVSISMPLIEKPHPKRI